MFRIRGRLKGKRSLTCPLCHKTILDLTSLILASMRNFNLRCLIKRESLASSARTPNNLKVLTQSRLKVVSKLPQRCCTKKKISSRLNRSTAHQSRVRMMINCNFRRQFRQHCLKNLITIRLILQTVMTLAIILTSMTGRNTKLNLS